MATVYTVRRPGASSGPSLSLLLLAGLCFACHAQSAAGGVAGGAAGTVPAMTLRGGSATDAAAAAPKQDASDAEAYMKEQLDYWNSLSKEQQEELLKNMSPEERANAEGELPRRPVLRVRTARGGVQRAERMQGDRRRLMPPPVFFAFAAFVSGKPLTMTISAESLQ
jgi:hypothetical protein